MTQIEKQPPASSFIRCIGAMFIWFIISFCIGLLAMFYGPGAAALILGLFLGFCGMTLHLILWAIGWKLHWSYAGLVFGAVTTFFVCIINLSNSAEPIVVLIIFVSFTLLSYVIYPIANNVLEKQNVP